jgi:hypothetical protein
MCCLQRPPTITFRLASIALVPATPPAATCLMIAR